jgi:integrase
MRKAGRKPGSIIKVHAMLRRALEQARRWHWITENPALDASPPRPEQTEIVPPGVAGVGRLLRAAEEHSPEAAMLLHLAAVTGSRRGELCALRWSDFALGANRGRLVISRAVISDGSLKKTKSRRERAVTLGAEMVGALAAYRRHLGSKCEDMGLRYPDDAYLFSKDPNGSRPWNPSTATHIFERLRSQVGLDEVRLHDLRHFSTTTQLAAGVPVKEVSGRHGWADATMPLNRYGHYLPGSDTQAADLMDQVVTNARAQAGGDAAAAELMDRVVSEGGA